MEFHTSMSPHGRTLKHPSRPLKIDGGSPDQRQRFKHLFLGDKVVLMFAPIQSHDILIHVAFVAARLTQFPRLGSVVMIREIVLLPPAVTPAPLGVDESEHRDRVAKVTREIDAAISGGHRRRRMVSHSAPLANHVDERGFGRHVDVGGRGRGRR